MSNECTVNHSAHGLRLWLSRRLDWFIPLRVRGRDPDALRRARLVVTFTWTLIAVGIIYSITFLAMDSPIGAVAICVAMSAGLANLYVMRWTASVFAAGNLLTLAFFGVLTALACRLEGYGAVTLSWYAAAPVVALSTAGRRSATAWLAVGALFLTAFYALDRAGYSFPNDLTPRHYELLGLLAGAGLIVLVLALALLYESAKNRALAELKSAEGRLLQERDFSDSTIASLPGIFYLFDSQGTLLRWNDDFEDITRYSSYELQSMQPLDFFRGKDRDLIEQSIHNVFTEGHATQEARLVTKDGTAIPHLFTGRRVMIDGKPHLIGMGLDITDRKQAEVALREAKVQADANAQRAEQAMADMERMNAAMTGREQRVLEMKQEVNDLLAHLGRARKYEHV